MDSIFDHQKEEQWAKVAKNKNQKGWKCAKFLSFVAKIWNMRNELLTNCRQIKNA